MNQPVAKIINAAKSKGKKLLAILIDPDKPDNQLLEELLSIIDHSDIQLIFFGGSLLTEHELDTKIKLIKSKVEAKVVTFPSGVQQVSGEADAILFLSLISGRNPELLIGQQVIAAPLIKRRQLEYLSTGYLLVDGGKPTTASYMSGTLPIPADKPEIAACTAMAGEMLGMKFMYLDAGSGAQNSVSPDMIRAVRESTEVPIIVGGGIRDAEKAQEMAEAGADVLVIGNATEKNPLLIKEIAAALNQI